MNGAAEANGSISGPLAGVQVSLDPYTLDSSIGKRRLQAIEQDGSLVFGDPKTPEARLTERLERIWNEHPNGLLDLTEADLLAMPQDEPISRAGGDTEDEPEEEERYRGDLMSWEEMEKLRSEVFGQLNDARNELWFALELAKTLSVSGGFNTQPPVLPGQVSGPPKRGKGGPGGTDAKSTPASTLPGVPGVEPPILPAGTFTTLPTTAPRKPLYREAYDLERALKAKQEALDDCSALIDAAVDELQHMAAAGEQFWDSIRTLRDGERGRGQWAIVPKPDFARAMVADEKAKDVVIPYAVDEAPAALRARCLAAFDLDPSKEEALAFGARSHLRLRITLDDGISMTASQLVDAQVDLADVRAMMELAQLEAFEEEVFSEILVEASQMSGAIIEGRSVKLEYEGQRLTLELCDPRQEEGKGAEPSDTAELLLLSSRLLLSRLHRARKLRYLYPTRAPSALPSMVQPLLRILRYSATVSDIEATLELFASTLRSAGLESGVQRSFEVEQEEGTSALQDLLKSGDDLDVLSCSFRLDFEQSQGVALSLPVTRAARLQTSRAAVDLSHPADLASIVAEDLALQLAHVALPILEDEIEDEAMKDQVFLDELEGCIVAGRAGNISLSIPAPYDKVTARLEGGEAHVEAFVSGKGLTLREWLGGLAARMS